MIRIAVVDDEKIIAEYISESIHKYSEKMGVRVSVDIFTDSVKFLNEYTTGKFDAAFLDLEMPVLSGDELSSKLAEADPDLLIVYVTNHSDDVFVMLKYMPIGFIRKRFFDDEIEEVIRVLVRKIESGRKTLSFVSNKVTYNIRLSNIVYIESKKNYCTIYLSAAESQKSYKIRCKLDDICDKYLSNDFVRIHKSIAVNCRYILAVLKNKVIVDGEKELSVSRGNSKELERKFLLYRRNNICR